MSSEDQDKDGSNNNTPSRPVGYGSPPVEHRFKKGQSGNPRGRPRRAAKVNPSFDPATQPTERLILEEAYRTVTIREGDKTIELPAVQAVMRSLAIAAMKGSRLSQKTFAEIVRAAEHRERTEAIATLEAAIEYKRRWTEEFARLKRCGQPEPELLPHPDDLEIDLRKGAVIINGPMTAEEKLAHDQRVQRRDAAQVEISEYAKLYRRARSPQSKEMWLDWWHSEQMIFDLINDGLKGRHKSELIDRSRHQNASQAGKALEYYQAWKRSRR